MVLGSVYIEPDASLLALPNSFETIRFAPGSIDARLDLTLSDTAIAGYLLTAKAGQRMRIELDTPNVQVYVLDPSGELLLPTGQGLGVWEFTLAQSGQQRLVSGDIHGNQSAIGQVHRDELRRSRLLDSVQNCMDALRLGGKAVGQFAGHRDGKPLVGRRRRKRVGQRAS